MSQVRRELLFELVGLNVVRTFYGRAWHNSFDLVFAVSLVPHNGFPELYKEFLTFKITERFLEFVATITFDFLELANLYRWTKSSSFSDRRFFLGVGRPALAGGLES